MAYVTLNGKLVKVERFCGNSFKDGRYRSIQTTNIAQKAKEAHSKKGIAEIAAKRAKLKGIKDGNCNVTACQKPGATWWNTSTRAYYCSHCAREINKWSMHDEGYNICFSSEEAAIAAKAMFTNAATNFS